MTDKTKLWEWMLKRFLRRHGYLPEGPVEGYLPKLIIIEDEINEDH